MARRAAQQPKRVRRVAQSASVIREADPGYALSGVELTSVGPISQVSKLNGGFKDSAFGDNKSRPIHRWIPWITGFSSEFVRDVFSQYLGSIPSANVTVVDRSCGMGTHVRR
jgi:hypothetical protein